MSLVIGGLTIGFIFALLALGILLSFRMVNFVDITPDGSFALGGAVAAVCISGKINPWLADWLAMVGIVGGINPWVATGIAFLAGGLTGLITATLNTRFGIQELLAGILVMTAVYSVNLRIMGQSNIPMIGQDSIFTPFENLLTHFFSGQSQVTFFGWEVFVSDIAMLLCAALCCLVVSLLLYFFLRTNCGMALRAAGCNPQMTRAQGVNNKSMILLALFLSNGLIGLSGALFVQYQGFADVQMGIGMMVWGFASIIIGEALVTRGNSIGLAIVAAIMGTLLFRLLISSALRWGLNPNDLKLVTALFVFIALVTPAFAGKIKKKVSTGRQSRLTSES